MAGKNQKLNKKDFQLVAGTAFFIASNIFAVWFFWERVWWLFFFLIFLAAGQLVLVQSKKVLVLFLLIGFGGAAFEAMAIFFGAWHYNSQVFWNIPVWLLPGWGNAAIIIVCFYELFSKIGFLEKK